MLPAITSELPAQVSKPTKQRCPPLKEGTTNSEAPDEAPAEFTKALARWHPTHGSVSTQSALCTGVSCPETEPAPSLHRETGWARCAASSRMRRRSACQRQSGPLLCPATWPPEPPRKPGHTRWPGKPDAAPGGPG